MLTGDHPCKENVLCDSQQVHKHKTYSHYHYNVAESSFFLKHMARVSYYNTHLRCLQMRTSSQAFFANIFLSILNRPESRFYTQVCAYAWLMTKTHCSHTQFNAQIRACGVPLLLDTHTQSDLLVLLPLFKALLYHYTLIGYIGQDLSKFKRKVVFGNLV